MRQRSSRNSPGAPPAGAWLTTYSDMVTLVLCFFVILFSISAVDARKFQQVVISMQSALGVLPGSRVPMEGPSLDPEVLRQQLAREEELAMASLLQRLEDYIRDQGLNASVTVTRETPGIVIRFADSVLFDLGRDVIKPEAESLLERVARFLGGEEYHLRVEGHTDNLPISNERFPSNWELSTARATRVVRFLAETQAIDPRRLSAVGFGEYRPLVPNTSDENRALNRRVDLVILRPSLSGQ
ncbi:MAG: flagellar motor protein MotB [Bacillota bacterium]